MTNFGLKRQFDSANGSRIPDVCSKPDLNHKFQSSEYSNRKAQKQLAQHMTVSARDRWHCDHGRETGEHFEATGRFVVKRSANCIDTKLARTMILASWRGSGPTQWLAKRRQLSDACLAVCDSHSSIQLQSGATLVAHHRCRRSEKPCT